ncbi:MAG: SIMPL domain-containing protein [Micromonosporaceae bacterium]
MAETFDGVLVTGAGRVALPPDVLLVRFGAEVVDTGVQQALDGCNRAMAAMNAVLRDGGAADADRQTSGASLYQAHDQHGQPRGWTASQDLTARLRDLGRAGDLITATIGAGGDAARLRTVNFDIDQASEAYRAARVKARRLAFDDARATAEQYASLAGRRLGVVISVQEGNAGYSPATQVRSMAFGAAESMPTEGGELDVRTTVEVRWELLS